MQLSRRRFFQTSAIATAAALATPRELFAFESTYREPQRTPQPGGPVLLNSNENPYGPWPNLTRAMQQALSLAHRYPDNSIDGFVDTVASFHRVKPEQVILGCGSGEILRLCAEIFTAPDIPVVTAAPTFEALGRHTQVRKREVKKVPLTSTYAHDLDRMADAIAGRPALFYICNPNNPTASLTPRKAIEDVLPKLHPQSVILIDEAYHHFALSSPDYVSFLDKPVHDGRIIVARTFSKIFGLAGMRMGYAIAEFALAARMAPYALPDNLNIVAAEVGVTALGDAAGLASAIKRNADDRDEFLRQARQRRIKCIPSAGNFVMIDTGKPIRQVIGHFRQRNILIGRPFPPYDTHARISLGKPEEMLAFWKTWDSFATA
ncbi:MAG TPA: aminotransferase class I/II-fold pyridoxal phosphate-dependent enzyme [Terriglobales bacterium]|nr:aminotransferase class I/II-fold pyridoxal phosphate-dependent enzyme [Terriglobales bacterium]